MIDYMEDIPVRVLVASDRFPVKVGTEQSRLVAFDLLLGGFRKFFSLVFPLKYVADPLSGVANEKVILVGFTV